MTHKYRDRQPETLVGENRDIIFKLETSAFFTSVYESRVFKHETSVFFTPVMLMKVDFSSLKRQCSSHQLMKVEIQAGSVSILHNLATSVEPCG